MNFLPNKLFIACFISLISLSCSDDNGGPNLTDTSDNCNETEVFDPNYTGTACCIQRNSELSLSDNIEYQYFTNLSNPTVEWQVNSGDIEIISGKNSNIVTIALGDSFTSGSILAIGTGTTGLQCSEITVITAK